MGAQRSQTTGEIILIRPVSFVALTTLSLCMAVGVALFITFASYTRRISVEGVLVPNTGVAKVYAPQAGIVIRKDIVEGQHVVLGQQLYSISTDVQSVQGGQTQAAIITQARQRKASLQQEKSETRQLQKNEQDNLRAKILGLRGQLAHIADQLSDQQTRSEISADAASRYQRLLAQGYVSEDQSQQRQADLLDQRSKLAELERDRSSTMQALSEATNDLVGLPLKQQNDLSQIDRSVIDVDQTLIESEARRQLAVTATEDGIATAVIAEPGQTIDPTHPLVSIVPSASRWLAHLLVPSSAVGFIRVGDPVLVRYQAYPYQKFGQYSANVQAIARVALSAAELAMDGGTNPSANAGSFYLVTVELRAQTVTAYGIQQPLQAGMTLQADILQERRRLYEWILEPLYSLTGKL